jgi:hypothetical protein
LEGSLKAHVRMHVLMDHWATMPYTTILSAKHCHLDAKWNRVLTNTLNCVNVANVDIFVRPIQFGFARVPPVIPSHEFEAITAAITDPARQALVVEWYRRDDNAVPAVSLMKPLDSTTMSRAQIGQFWSESYGAIREALRQGASVALADNPSRNEFYHMSVTEEEIHAGLYEWNSDQIPKRALVLHRELDNIDDVLEGGCVCDGVSRNSWESSWTWIRKVDCW